MNEPTPRQLEVLAAIVAHIEEHGRPPTLLAIGRRIGVGSTNGVNEHLCALRRKGLLERQPKVSCGLRVTAAGYAAVGKVHERALAPRECQLVAWFRSLSPSAQDRVVALTRGEAAA